MAVPYANDVPYVPSAPCKYTLKGFNPAGETLYRIHAFLGIPY